MQAPAQGLAAQHGCRRLLECELAAEVIQSSGRLRLRVRGSSMLPALRPGDVLTVESARPGDIRVGDLAVFSRDEQLCAHRVISVSPQVVITRGDAVWHNDPPLCPDRVLGRVALVDRGRRQFVPCRSLNYFQRFLCLFCRFDFLKRLAARLQALRRTWHRQIPH